MENYAKCFNKNKENETPIKIDTENDVIPVSVDQIEDVFINGTVTNCVNLNVRKTPEFDSDVITLISVTTKVVIDEGESTEEFYKIHTASGAEGFCMKQFISIDQ